MFQNTNSRSKGNRRREKGPVRLSLSIKRISGILEITSTQGNPRRTPIRLILNDLSLEGAGFFCQETLPAEQKVKFIIESPGPLEANATVVWCQEHGATHHVFSQEIYPYRAGIQFLFEKEDQKSQLQELLKLIKKPT